MFEKRSSSASPKQQLRKSKSLTTTGTNNLMTVVDMTLKRRSTGCINRRSSSIYSTTSTASNALGKVIKFISLIFYIFFINTTLLLLIGNLAPSWILRDTKCIWT